LCGARLVRDRRHRNSRRQRLSEDSRPQEGADHPRGANIYPREIEEVLYQHPKVLEAAAVGVPDPRLGERVCACVVPQSGESLTLDELVAFLTGKIATYKLPEFLHLLDALPRTPTGKVQKGPLRDIVLKGMASA
jgi:acyl-CoA synthetase (AMP-forming)/AMP-acid ligase II